MKKFLAAIAAPMLLGACTPNATTQGITGTLTGVASDSLFINYYPAGNRDALVRDTIPMQQGKFSFAFDSDTTAMEVYLMAIPPKSKDGKMVAAISMRGIAAMVLPGQTVNVTGTLEDFKIEGGEFYTAYNEACAQCEPYMNQIDSVSKICMEMSRQKASQDSINKKFFLIQEYYQKIEGVKADYILQHPNSDVSVYLASQLSPVQLEKVLPAIGEQARKGVLAGLYDERVKALEKSKAMQEAQKVIQVGKEAPAFTLKDLDGKDFSLASLKGKYVILDFWGSWCGWCIKGFPALKAAYEKHKDKIEVVGIACRDTDQKWRKAVAEHELKWINVRNEGNPDVSAAYAVSGYPTKILVDPEGKIAKIVIGEDPAFYTYLDDLLK